MHKNVKSQGLGKSEWLYWIVFVTAKLTSLPSLFMTSQVESVGSLGDVLSDLRWRSQDKEENLCEDLSDSSVCWTACWSSEVWEGSMPRYTKPVVLKSFLFFYFGVFISLCSRFLCQYLGSQMSAHMPWGPPQRGLQPVCVWQTHTAWTSPQCDWCPCGGSLGGTGQPAQGRPCSYRRRRSVQALRGLLFKSDPDLDRQGQVCPNHRLHHK